MVTVKGHTSMQNIQNNVRACWAVAQQYTSKNISTLKLCEVSIISVLNLRSTINLMNFHRKPGG